MQERRFTSLISRKVKISVLVFSITLQTYHQLVAKNDQGQNCIILYIYTMAYYSAMRKNDILPFATAWMDTEHIMLNQISQTETDKYSMISLIHGIFKIKHVKKPQRVKQWLPGDGGQGVTLMVFKGTNLYQVLKQPQRFNVQFIEHR